MQLDAAILGVISQALNLAAAIIYTVSGALGTAGTALGIIIIQFARASGRVQWGLSAALFGEVGGCRVSTQPPDGC